MQQQSSHWYLTASPLNVMFKSSWMLFPAIFTLLAFDVIESSIIAAHGDNSLTAFGFLLPLITLMSAISLAVAVRSNMVLVKNQSNALNFIPSLLLFTLFIGSGLMLMLHFFQGAYLELLGVNAWLNQFDSKLLNHYRLELAQFLGFKIPSLISLMLVWQLSSMLRAIGLCKFSAIYLFSWMAFKTTWLVYFIDGQSISLISTLGKMHFYSDSVFAIIGLTLLFSLRRIDLSQLSLLSLFKQKRLSFMLTFQQLIPALSILVLTVILSRFDEGYVAAFALLIRLEAFLLLLPMVFTASIPTVVGICYWAANHQQWQRIIKLACVAIVIVQLCLAIVVVAMQSELLTFLCPDCHQKQIINGYLAFLPFSYGFLGIALITPSCLNAVGQVTSACKLLILHRLLCVPVFSLVGLILANEIGLFGGLFLAHLFICLLILWRYRVSQNKQGTPAQSHVMQSTPSIAN